MKDWKFKEVKPGKMKKAMKKKKDCDRNIARDLMYLGVATAGVAIGLEVLGDI